MNIDWYVFEESYLLDIDYKIVECTIEIKIDARISNNHPKVSNMVSCRNYFEEIKIVLKGIQYLNTISSLNLSSKENEDLGNIDMLLLRDYSKVSDYVKIVIDKNTLKLSIEDSEQVFAEVYSKINKIKFIEFISDMIAFKAAFNEIEVIV